MQRVLLNTSRQRRRDQQGASLIMVILVVALVGIILASLVAYLNVSHATSPVYASVRDLRYAGDSAIKQAINWAKDVDSVAVDPAYLPAAADSCVYTAQTDSGEQLKVDCQAIAGSGSGRPEEGGLTPSEALVLTGARQNESGPYNATACSGVGNVVWDALNGWFNGSASSTYGIQNLESSLLVRKMNVDSFLTCSQRTRPLGTFYVDGNVRAAGRVVVDGAAKVQPIGASTIRARYGCAPSNACTTGMDTRADGTQADSDPGIDTSAVGYDAKNPWRFMKTAWQAVGFNKDGTVTDPAKVPARDAIGTPGRAFVWNPTTSRLEATPNANCTGSDSSGNAMTKARTIVFLPGWYRSAATFNQYTTSPTCAGFTVWLAPQGRFDGSGAMLSTGAETGAYYLDFRAGAGTKCNDAPAHSSRWCIGGATHDASSRAKVRVLVGTPKGWEPLGMATAGTGENQSTTEVSFDTANTVDNDLSVTWSNEAGAKKLGDGSLAVYQPTCLLGVCSPSSDRAIRIRDFGPKVSAGAYDYKVNLDVGIGLLNPSPYQFQGTLDIAAVSKESGQKDCGRYAITLPSYSGSGAIPVVSLSNPVSDNGSTLGARCSTDDLLNGLEVMLKVTGNTFNVGVPKVWFDGVKVSYAAYQGASFPGSSATPGAAPSDCDTTEPGAQLIFGGDSHVYATDGSLEVCAGDYPVNAGEHMNIGVYGVPSVPVLRPTVSTTVTGTPEVNGISCSTTAPTISGASNAAMIAEPSSDPFARSSAVFRYGNQCLNIFVSERGPYDGGIWGSKVSFARSTLTFPSYSAPAGYQVKKIEARVAYNSNNPSNAFNWAAGNHSRLETPSGPPIDVPFTSATVNWSNSNKLTLYGPGAEVANRVTPAQLASGVSLYWRARGACIAGLCPFKADSLDGVELLVTLEPTAASDAAGPRLTPQSGCIIAYPNYGDGQGAPDCAVVKSEQRVAADLNPGTPTVGYFYKGDGDWYGRASVKGTVYAPSAAMDLDDSDVAYSLASRGAVLRHLRIKGFGTRSDYLVPVIGAASKSDASPRYGVFTACRQSTARLANANAKCDESQGDHIVSRAGVRFAVRADGSASDVPVVQWWTAGNEMAPSP